MSADAVTPNLRSGHVGLNVTDLDRSMSFYVRVFGLEVLDESTDPERRYAFLGSDGTPLLTLWQQSQGQFSTDLPGLHHVAFQVTDLEAVRRVERTLRELGAPLHYDGVVRHRHDAESAGVFFSDPDGIRLEIFASTGEPAALALAHSAPACGFF